MTARNVETIVHFIHLMSPATCSKAPSSRLMRSWVGAVVIDSAERD